VIPVGLSLDRRALESKRERLTWRLSFLVVVNSEVLVVGCEIWSRLAAGLCGRMGA
jgi:hypothetical protein